MRVLEPMFAVEAKKRYDETVGRPSKQLVGNFPPNNKAKASDQAAKVVSASTGTNGTTLFPSEYRH